MVFMRTVRENCLWPNLQFRPNQCSSRKQAVVLLKIESIDILRFILRKFTLK